MIVHSVEMQTHAEPKRRECVSSGNIAPLFWWAPALHQCDLDLAIQSDAEQDESSKTKIVQSLTSLLSDVFVNRAHKYIHACRHLLTMDN